MAKKGAADNQPPSSAIEIGDWDSTPTAEEAPVVKVDNWDPPSISLATDRSAVKLGDQTPGEVSASTAFKHSSIEPLKTFFQRSLIRGAHNLKLIAGMTTAVQQAAEKAPFLPVFEADLGAVSTANKLENYAVGNISSQMEKLKKEQKEKIVEGFWTQDLPSVAGSIVPPLAAGVISPYLAATVGAAQAGGAGAQDILFEKPEASEDEINLASDLNGLLGLSSGWVAFRQLERLGLTKPIAEYLKKNLGKTAGQKATQFARDRTLSALENAAQETLEQIGSNVIASDIIGYDPDRPLNEQLADAAKGGASAAVILDLILGGARYTHAKTMRDEEGNTRWQQKYKERKAKERAAAVDPANFANIQGEFTPLTEPGKGLDSGAVNILQQRAEIAQKNQKENLGWKGEKVPVIEKNSLVYYDLPDDKLVVSDGIFGTEITHKQGQFWAAFYDASDNLVEEKAFDKVTDAEKAGYEWLRAQPTPPAGTLRSPRFAFVGSNNNVSEVGGIDENAFSYTPVMDAVGNVTYEANVPGYRTQQGNLPIIKVREPNPGKFEAQILGDNGVYVDRELTSTDVDSAKAEAFDIYKMSVDRFFRDARNRVASNLAGTLPHNKYTYGQSIFDGIASKNARYELGGADAKTLEEFGASYENELDAQGNVVALKILDPMAKPQKKVLLKSMPGLGIQIQTRASFLQQETQRLQALKNRKVTTSNKVRHDAAIKAQEAVVKEARKKLKDAKTVELIEKRVAYVLNKMLPTLQKIIPERKFVLKFAAPHPQHAGSFEAGEDAHIINMYHPLAYTSLQKGTRKQLTTLWHEIGHALSRHYLQKHLDKLRAEHGEDFALVVRQMQEQHQAWLHDKVLRDVDELADIFPDMVSTQLRATGRSSFGRSTYLSYFGGAEEFFAELFSNIMENTRGQPLTQELNKTMRAVLRDMEADFNALRFATGPNFLDSPNSFKDFIKLLDLKAEFADWVKDNGKKVLSREEAFKALFFHEPGKEPPYAIWSRESAEEWIKQKEVYNRYMRLTYNLAALLDANPHLDELRDYVQAVKEWHAFRLGLIKVGDDWTRATMKLSRDQRNKLARMVFDEDRKERFWTLQEMQAAGITQETFQVYQHMRGIFRMALKQARDSTESLIRESFANDPEELRVRLAELDNDFSQMENKPYFPHMRYGEWSVVVHNQAGKVIQVVTADTRLGQHLEYKRARAQFAGQGVTISKSKLSDGHRALQGMPAFFMKELMKKIPNLTKEQTDVLEFMIQEHSPVRGYKARFLHRRGVEGYSEDLIRGFNSYVMSWSSHVARSKHMPLAQLAINRLNERGAIKRTVDEANVNELMQIKEHLDRHLDYIANPQNEWQALRTFIFFQHLWLNVKSAAVNLTSLPMVTWPYLASRFGNEEASRAMTWATNQLGSVLTTGANADPRAIRFYAWGIEQGFIDQALMTEVAVAASEYSEHKNPLNPPVKKFIYNLVFAGAVPFQIIEKTNRVVTGFSAMKLGLDMGMSETEAFAFARKTVEDTQNENARWNNPEFARGKAGAFFPFMRYVTHIVNKFAFGGDPASMYWWLVMASMAGVTGLPFAEDVEEIVSGILTQYRQRMGIKNPHVDLNRSMHELIGSLGADPELVMHGLSRESFGLTELANEFGVPFPGVDLSASLGLGNILPGTQAFKQAMQNKDMTSAELLGALAEESGATASSIMGIVGSMVSDDPSTWARAEAALPAALKNVSKAERIRRQEALYDRQGNIVAEFDSEDPLARMELLGLTFGFKPEKISRGQEELWWKKQIVAYYNTRAVDLINKLNHAKYTKDREGIAAARKAIRIYDNQVPFPILRIGIRAETAYQEYVKSKTLRRMDIPSSMSTYQLWNSVEGAQEAAPRE